MCGDIICDPEPASLGGNGLFLESFKDAVEADGVTAGDCAGSLDCTEDADGDDVPSLLSLFFFEDLLGSLLLESWSCCVS